jgi:hypothetical protein
MAFDEGIVIRRLSDLDELSNLVDLADVVDMQCTETTLAAAYEGAKRGLSGSALARLGWRLDHVDKYEMSRKLAASGVSVPRAAPGSTPVAEALRIVGCPLVVKGRAGSGGDHVALVSSPVEAEDAVNRLGGPDATYFEEFIVGENVQYASCRSGGQVSAEVTFVTRRLGSTSLGPAIGVETVDDAEMAGLGRSALAAVGGDGLANVEALRRADGRTYVIDVNLRVWGSAATFSAAAIDFADAYAASLGRPTATEITQVKTTRTVEHNLDVFPDAAAALAYSGSYLAALVSFAQGTRRYLRSLGPRYLVGAAALLASSFWHRLTHRRGDPTLGE